MAKRSLVSLVLLLSGVLSSLTASAAVIKTDFVFMIDATGSMSGEINGVRNGFSNFVSGLNAADVDARFAVVVYGGEPELTLDFTSDSAVAETALNNVVIGSRPGVQNNHNRNPEAGLEVIRMLLGAAPVSELANNNIPTDGLLQFRSDARKNLILATDEDSDLPFFSDNRFSGQTTGEPPSNGPANSNWAAWQAEIDATAAAVINQAAYLNMLIGTDNPSGAQYGDFSKDVASADLLNFDAAATLANLQADPFTANSLQAQVLASNQNLIARTFNVQGANDADFVDNFFAAKIQEVVTDPCQVDPASCEPGPGSVPIPGTLYLAITGMLGLGALRRRRR